MGPTLTVIYNKALAHLSQRPVSSPTDGTLQAAVLNRLWPTCRQDVLAGHDWGCATTTAELTVLDDTTFYLPPNWLYGYSYPSTCVAFWKVFDPNILEGFALVDNDNSGFIPSAQLLSDAKKRYKSGSPFIVAYDPTLAAKIIFTNVEDAVGQYTVDVTEPTLYSPTLVTALALRLAMDACVSLTGDDVKAKGLVSLYNTAMSEAERMTGYETGNDSETETGLIDSRG